MGSPQRCSCSPHLPAGNATGLESGGKAVCPVHPPWLLEGTSHVPRGGEPEEVLCGSPRPGSSHGPPPPEAFPPDEITSPAGEQAPIVKAGVSRERVPFRSLKIAALRCLNPHGVEWPTRPQRQHGPWHPAPHRDLLVTSWRVHSLRQGRAAGLAEGSYTTPTPTLRPVLALSSLAGASADGFSRGPHQNLNR